MARRIDLMVQAMMGRCKINGWNTFFCRWCFLAQVIFNSGSQQVCRKSFSTTFEKEMASGEGQGSMAHFGMNRKALNQYCCLWQQKCSIKVDQWKWRIRFFVFKLKANSKLTKCIHPKFKLACSEPQFNGNTSVMAGLWCLGSLIEMKLTL